MGMCSSLICQFYISKFGMHYLFLTFREEGHGGLSLCIFYE